MLQKERSNYILHEDVSAGILCPSYSKRNYLQKGDWEETLGFILNWKRKGKHYILILLPASILFLYWWSCSNTIIHLHLYSPLWLLLFIGIKISNLQSLIHVLVLYILTSTINNCIYLNRSLMERTT